MYKRYFLIPILLIAMDVVLCKNEFIDLHADVQLFESVNSDSLQTTEEFSRQTISIHKNNIFRIFWFGGSAARGYPFMWNESIIFPNADGTRNESSSAKFLELLLGKNKSKPNFEVVNFALNGSDTRTAYYLIREAVNYKPDLIVLQTGHNEFFPDNVNYSVATHAYIGPSTADKILYYSFGYRSLARRPPPINTIGFWFERNNLVLTSYPYINATLRIQILDSFKTYLEKISDLCEKSSIRLVLLTANSNEEWPPDRSYIIKTNSKRG